MDPTRCIRRVLCVLLASLALGCTSHHDTSHEMKTIDSVRPGTPMSAVHDRLGGPDQKYEGVMPAVPPPGPLEALVGRVPPGAPYRDWVYSHGDSRFHVLFAHTTVESGEPWEVVAVRSEPKTAVTAMPK
jgi:hypothetical protein